MNYEASVDLLGPIVRDWMDAYHIATERLTRVQLAQAISQAIVCGDFTRHVQVGYPIPISLNEDGSIASAPQAVTYIPYRCWVNDRERIEAARTLIEQMRRVILNLHSENPEELGNPMDVIRVAERWLGWTSEIEECE